MYTHRIFYNRYTNFTCTAYTYIGYLDYREREMWEWGMGNGDIPWGMFPFFEKQGTFPGERSCDFEKI